MKLSQLLQIPHLPHDPEVTHIAYDSRKVQPGSLFVAIRGQHTDGHRYLGEALNRGAVAALVEKRSPSVPLLQIEVNNIREVLPRIAARFFGEPSKDLTVIGITGTNGKTTTAFLLHAILKGSGLPTGLITTVRYQTLQWSAPADLTTPESVDLQRMFRQILDEGGKAVVMEVSSHGVVEHRVDAVDFDFGIFTMLGRDHLDFHGSFEAYREAKASFLRRVRLGVSLNADDPHGPWMKEQVRAPRVKTYGLQCGDLRGKILRNDLFGLELQTLGWFEDRFQLPIPGRFNAYNLLAALTLGRMLGLAPENMREALRKEFHGVPGRFETVIQPGEAPFQVIIDFAHTPDALESLLREVRQLHPKRVITVFGAGGDRDRGKRPLMGQVAAQWSEIVIVTSDNPRSEDPEHIIQEIVQGIPPDTEAQVITVVDRGEAIAKALHLAQPGDVVVLAGKGHEDYMVIGQQKVPFREKDIVRRVLKEIGYVDSA